MTLEKLRIPLLVAITAGFIVSLIGIPLSLDKPEYFRVSALFLLLTVVLVAAYHEGEVRKSILLFTAIAVAGWIIEALGVKTGVIFGEYRYGPSLGPKLLDAPIVIGLNWALLTYFGYIIASPIADPTRRKVAGAGAMVLFDIILEPAADKIGLWQFHNHHVPMQNYFFWFIFGYMFLSLIRKADLQFTNRIAAPLFWIQLGFFLLLDFILIMMRA